jgi:hypothetical protein
MCFLLVQDAFVRLYIIVPVGLARNLPWVQHTWLTAAIAMNSFVIGVNIGRIYSLRRARQLYRTAGLHQRLLHTYHGSVLMPPKHLWLNMCFKVIRWPFCST